jgi:hypothetical protein
VPVPCLCCACTVPVLCLYRDCAVAVPCLCCACTMPVLCLYRACAVPVLGLNCACTVQVLCVCCAVRVLCCACAVRVLCLCCTCAVLMLRLCCWLQVLVGDRPCCNLGGKPPLACSPGARKAMWPTGSCSTSLSLLVPCDQLLCGCGQRHQFPCSCLAAVKEWLWHANR